MTITERLTIYGPALCVCGRRTENRHSLTCGPRGKHEAPAGSHDMEAQDPRGAAANDPTGASLQGAV